MPVDYKLPLDITNKILEFYHPGRLLDISFVAFFCAVIKQEVINKVGLLDTNYALGMWDDNDYCIAARKFGYDVKLLADTCITHHGRTTFTLLQETENFNITELMAKNKAYLNKKWRLNTVTVVPKSSPSLSLNSRTIPISHKSWRDKLGSAESRSINN